MISIKEIEKVYYEIENRYASNEFAAHVKGNVRREEFWRKKREINTHAYFLFVFTRLEDHLKNKSTNLISSKQTSISKWKPRAVWDITNASRLEFRKRVTLLTETGQTDHNKIISYYSIRNSIAHGGTVPGIVSAINMITVFADMKNFLKKIK